MTSNEEVGFKTALSPTDSTLPSVQDTRSVNRRKAATRMAVSEIASFSWLVPITILLTVNFHGWIIGASVGCGFQKSNCDLDPFGLDVLTEAKRLDRRDHNILGALQLVAKTLEVWFVIIIVSLVYDLSMLFAVKGDGLPIGYLMIHREFADILTLGERAFWLSANPSGRRRYCFFAFIGVIVLLSITANLMGPATAVLVLPTLQWSDIPLLDGGVFQATAAARPPSNASIANGCQVSGLQSGNYSCTMDIYGESLDSLSASISSGNAQRELDSYGNVAITPGILQEGQVSFTVNITDDIFWVPNRQVLRDLSNDFIPYFESTDENATYKSVTWWASKYQRTLSKHLYSSYRNNVQVILHRGGPTIGSFFDGCGPGNVTLIQLPDERMVRCYTGIANNTQSLCFRVGAGWRDTKIDHSQFSIADTSLHSAGSVSVDIYSTNRAIYVNQTSPCLSRLDATLPIQLCNWDQLFSTSTSSYSFLDDSLSQQILEYNVPQLGGPNLTVWCTYYAYLAVAEYSLDPTPATNFLEFVQLNVGQNISSEPLYVHPDWILASWSVARSGTVAGNREASVNIISALKAAYDVPIPDTRDQETIYNTVLSFDLQNTFIIAQALSLIGFNTTAPSTTYPPSLSHPLFPVTVSLRAWAYSLESRTSKFGAAVALFGCLCVLFRAGLHVVTRSEQRSTLEVIAAALKNGEDQQLGDLGSEAKIARVKMRVCAEEEGRLRFVAG